MLWKEFMEEKCDDLFNLSQVDNLVFMWLILSCTLKRLVVLNVVFLNHWNWRVNSLKCVLKLRH